jgi:hypothetical protein
MGLSGQVKTHSSFNGLVIDRDAESYRARLERNPEAIADSASRPDLLSKNLPACCFGKLGQDLVSVLLRKEDESTLSHILS